MRVALVTAGYHFGGGMQTLVDSVLQALAGDDGVSPFLVDLALSSRDPLSVRTASPASWLRGVAVAQAQDPRGFPSFSIGACWPEFEAQRYRPRPALDALLSICDVVHVVAGFPAWANAIGPVAAPIVLQIATLAEWERETLRRGNSLRSRLARWTAPLLRRLDQRGLARADRVLVLNRRMLSEVASRIGPDRVDLCPPGIDASFFVPDPDVPRRHLLSVGRLGDPRKNFPLLLAAYSDLVSRLPDAPPLVLAGYEILGPESQALIARHSLGNRVIVRTGVDRQELLALYRGAHAFVLASNEEGLGIVLLEAMACGTPVLATRCGGPESIIADSKDGLLVAPGDRSGLSRALERLMTAPDLRARLGTNARQSIESRFSLAEARARLLRAYGRG